MWIESQLSRGWVTVHFVQGGFGKPPEGYNGPETLLKSHIDRMVRHESAKDAGEYIVNKLNIKLNKEDAPIADYLTKQPHVDMNLGGRWMSRTNSSHVASFHKGSNANYAVEIIDNPTKGVQQLMGLMLSDGYTPETVHWVLCAVSGVPYEPVDPRVGVRAVLAASGGKMDLIYAGLTALDSVRNINL